ncbi:hypothetical protein WT02_10170 [Burkholderia stagnalis]|nr:hypothetical protein WT03_02400 [Burkholderia stagnalis]KVL98392.1 hypothetical protein WT02_10170 [Burkholderia stagnalis]KVM16683.1 hypothetical protein WT04_03150 [Burkholderia stagnalis]
MSSTPSGTESNAVDAPAVAKAGEAAGASESDAIATSASNAQASGDDAGGGAVDEGNVDVSPAAGQSASDIASYAPFASQGGDTAAHVSPDDVEALHVRVAELEQQLTDEQAKVAEWQRLYNAATAQRDSGEPRPAHRWLALLEGKLNALEHAARDELLDVARQLREAL